MNYNPIDEVDSFVVTTKPPQEEKLHPKDVAKVLWEEQKKLMVWLKNLSKGHLASFPEDECPYLFEAIEGLKIEPPKLINDHEGRLSCTQFRNRLLESLKNSDDPFSRQVEIEYRKIWDNYKETKHMNSGISLEDETFYKVIKQSNHDYEGSRQKAYVLLVVHSLFRRIESVRKNHNQWLHTGFTFGDVERGFDLDRRTVSEVMNYVINNLKLVKKLPKKYSSEPAKYVLGEFFNEE